MKATPPKKPEPIVGTVVKRQSKGRLTSPRGIARTHANLLQRLLHGELDPMLFEAASRGMWRQAQIVRGIEEAAVAERLARQLEALQHGASPLPVLPAPTDLPEEMPDWAREPGEDGQG
jgi:hypothetical protein